MTIRHSRRPADSPASTRRSLLAGAAAGLVTAAGAVAAGPAAAASASASTATPDWLNVVAGYGADPTGTTDSTAAFQNAIDALPAQQGGVVYVPAGTYKISSAALQPVSGLRLTGDGNLSTIISSVTNSLIKANIGSQLDSVEIDHLTLQATGSDVISGAWISRWSLHDCRLIQNSAANAIWNAPSVMGMTECVFEHNLEFAYGVTRTIDAWFLSCGSGPPQINQTVWRDNVCFNQGGGSPPVYDNTHYWYHLIQAGANVNQANSFVNIVFEHCCGGAIAIESAVGTVIDNCWSYDNPANTVANAIFSIKKNPTGGTPQLTTIRNSGRLGPGLNAGVADIALDLNCIDTTISGCGCNQGNQPFVLDLGNSSPVTLSGLPRSYTLLNASGAPFVSQLPGSSPQPEDVGYAGWAYDSAAASGAGLVLPAAGVTYLIQVPLRTARKIGNVRIHLTAAGAGLTPGNFAGVYSNSGNLIAASADQATAWAGSPGVIDAALVNGPFAVGPGFVWVALLFNGKTGPAIDGRAAGAAAMANGNLTPASARFGSVLRNRTTLQSHITPATIALTAVQWWVAIW